MLAIADSQIVGALLSQGYVRDESNWPKGWKELTARGIQFDIVDVDIPIAVAIPMLETYRPK
jgi:hypothetical protein